MHNHWEGYCMRKLGKSIRRTQSCAPVPRPHCKVIQIQPACTKDIAKKGKFTRMSFFAGAALRAIMHASVGACGATVLKS